MLVSTRFRASATVLSALLSAALAFSAAAAGFRAERAPAPQPASVPLVTGKSITPRGRHTPVDSFPVNMVPSPDGRFLVVTHGGARQSLLVLNARDGSRVSRVEVNAPRTDGSKKTEGLYYGLVFGPPVEGKWPLYASRGAEDRVAVYTLDAAGQLAPAGRSLENPSGVPDFKAPHNIAGLALSADGRRLYAVNNNTSPESGLRGSLSVLDTVGGRVTGKVSLPGFPLAAAAVTRGATADRKLYVSSERDGVVSVVDPSQPALLKDLPTGDHPVGLLLDRKQERLFVANSGSDTVSVIDTRTDRVTTTVLLRPDDARGLPGATPLGLALAPDEKRLYVTLADMNAVAVVELPKGKLTGYVPVGWYPTSVTVSADGKRLFVTNAKGTAERNPNPPQEAREGAYAPGRGTEYVLNRIEGSVSMLPVPSRKTLERDTEQVIANNRIRPGLEGPGNFRNPGIQHVVYILKENRTYDQILGDLPTGNGDPKLCFFPRPVTPNQHALAERFVLLDNFYCCADVSADGWNWSTSGMANEYVERNSKYGYTGRGRNYDYEGQNNGVPADLRGLPDVARAPGGYIWDLVAAKGLPFRNYGFFVNVSLTDAGIPNVAADTPGNQATKKVLLDRTDENYRQFDMTYADSDAWVLHNAPSPSQMRAYGKFGARSRYAEWKREFDGYVRQGSMPRFTMIRLPRDHTQGTAAGLHSPRAMVADNDYGVGQVVEAISQSPFWKNTAIFVIEDDAQNGFDHVDAHRSVCYVISPFVKRGTVDHRFYNTDSVLRTMELLLGLPPMNQFDAVAPPLEVFGAAPDNAAPYGAILPDRAICAEVNGRRAYRAADSAKLDFSKEDAVPDEVLNDILWHAIMGRNAPKPAIRSGLRLYAEEEEED